MVRQLFYSRLFVNRAARIPVTGKRGRLSGIRKAVRIPEAEGNTGKEEKRGWKKPEYPILRKRHPMGTF